MQNEMLKKGGLIQRCPILCAVHTINLTKPYAILRCLIPSREAPHFASKNPKSGLHPTWIVGPHDNLKEQLPMHFLSQMSNHALYLIPYHKHI